jgi:hypothetical protein
MKKRIGGRPYWEVTFDKEGKLLDGNGLPGELGAEQVTDLFIFSHGWNSSAQGARRHYDAIFGQIAAQSGANQAVGFAGVFWPSLLFPQDDPAASGPVLADGNNTQSLSPLAAPAPLGPGESEAVSSGPEIAAALTSAFPGQEEDLAVLGDLLERRPQDPDELDRFVRLARGLVTTPNDAPEDNGEETTLVKSPRNVLDAMAALATPTVSNVQGFNPFGALWKGAKELLRTTSYYEMKNRAGVVGEKGLARLVNDLAATPAAPRIHLLGHSFGARLVSYVLPGLPTSAHGAQSPVKSLLLLQGAFSHFAFADKAPVTDGKGALAAFGDRVDGPLLATYTGKDRAVGWWYPNASRLAWQDSQDLRNPNFRWGGMGTDGYQQEGAEAATLKAQGSAYQLQKGHFYRLNADAVINRRLSWFSGSHSDIDKPEVAWAALSAAALTP